jgi:hypothetical protein
MAKDVVIDLNYPNTSDQNTIGDLIVSPFIAPNAQIEPAHKHSPDGQIASISLTISGHDAAGATLSLSGVPGFSLTGDPTNGYTLVGPSGATNAQWSTALDAVKGDSPDLNGSFKVTVQAFNSADKAISGKSVDRVFVCFAAGTLISTPVGASEVESLKIGDLVMTADGRAAPVRWIGRQTISRLFADPLRTLPIRIKADALGDNVPSRDLLISPDHALLIDGALVHAGALINGASIVREYDTPQVFTYFHVELADHSLILAENTPAETFVDNVDRLAFDNWAEHEALYGADAPIEEMNYPRAKAARQVPQTLRARLAARAARLYPQDQAEVA